MTRTIRPTSTKRENLCGDGCDASFAVSSGRLRRVLCERRRRPPSVAGVLAALLAVPALSLAARGRACSMYRRPRCSKSCTRSLDHPTSFRSSGALFASFMARTDAAFHPMAVLRGVKFDRRNAQLKARRPTGRDFCQPSTPSPALRRVRRAIQASLRRVLLAYSRTSLTRPKL